MLSDPQASLTAVSPQAISPQQCTNLLARLLYEAFAPQAGREAATPRDITLPLKLLAAATPGEVAEAERTLRTELRVNLSQLLEIIPVAERTQLQSILADKHAEALKESTLPGAHRRREFVLQELERANFSAHPKRPRSYSLDEKLTVLTTYVGMIQSGVSGYPDVLANFDAAGIGERHPDCPPQIVRSLRAGRWDDIGPVTSCEELLRKLEDQIADVTSLIRKFADSRDEINPESAKRFIQGLTYVNRLAIDYAYDLVHDAMKTFRETKPQNIVERLIGAKPEQACRDGLSAVLTRYWIVRRATGVDNFLTDMSGSLKLV